ncbi:MAG: hypothetical protein A2X94_02505 [Bdellovibrionales bacterium GWB1_55_8]|nr:MAG: hypothetical protein A2X94_02505 [Bdellovibrionales bacterium GWB1_55_8]
MISLIAALSKNRAIGKGNQLPWHLPEDLKYFRATTSGHPVIMGRKTFQSIGRPLPKRFNVVVSRDARLEIPGVAIASSLAQAIALCEGQPGAEEIFIIGGAEIYREALPHADRLYLTEIDLHVDGDAFFPDWPAGAFKEISRTPGDGSPAHEFIILQREKR